MDAPASTAVRKSQGTSLGDAIELVRDGKADAVVSAGNSGAFLAIALVRLRTIAGIARPAIGAVLPGPNGPVVLCDAGANVDCRPEWLVQFGMMGAAYARAALGVADPRVGLVSVGEEPTKGNAQVLETADLLRNAPVRFVGNIEGKDILLNHADVVVADGFVGNVILKTAEGAATYMRDTIRESFASAGLIGKLGGLLSRSVFAEIRVRANYSTYGGAPLLGVRGNCVVAHGRSDATAIRNAIRQAALVGGRRPRRLDRRGGGARAERAFRVNGAAQRRVAIVTDSTADLDRRMRVRAASTWSRCSSTSATRAFEIASTSRWTSSTASSRACACCPRRRSRRRRCSRDAFRPHAEAGRSVVCSRSWRACRGRSTPRTRRRTSFPGAEIHVVDSETVAGGLALVAQHASEVANAGADARAVLDTLAHDQRGAARLGDDPRPLARRPHGTRLARASLRRFAREDRTRAADRARRDRGARARTHVRARRRHDGRRGGRGSGQSGRRARVRDAFARRGSRASVLERVRAKITTANASFELLEAGPVIGTHAGPGAVGIFVLPRT